MTPEGLLQQWIEARVDPKAAEWLRGAAETLRKGGGDRDLYRLISLVSRQLGKAPLALRDADFAAATAARPGWNPAQWTVDQAGRVFLLLIASIDPEIFSRRLDQLCATADIDELVAFYRGLPLYPDQPRHRLRAAEGIRTNMTTVFEAVAHRNPYPSEQLSEEAWNQMVLKTLFVGSTLVPVVGFEQRANPTLAGMASRYAHERWAAGRPVSPELWRCFGRFAAGDLLSDLEKVLAEGTPPERSATALALGAATDPAAQKLLDRHA
ncbi:MAG: EboA domain-containing protein, partial [Burkholderiales bacterium]|nr:EboA domain-containing protein [Burkholderiales bacterium]